MYYEELFKILEKELDDSLKKQTEFEFIFMTYSYVHKMINPEAFPSATILFDEEKKN